MTKILIIVAAACSIFAAPAAYFVYQDEIRSWLNERNNPGDTEQTTQTESDPSTPIPTNTPSAVPAGFIPTEQLIAEAMSLTTSEGRNDGLKHAAEIALNRDQYYEAIRAADASVTATAQAATLTHIAHRAIEEGLYKIALDAAEAITLSEERNKVQYEVFCAIQAVDYEPFLQGRRPMYATPKLLPSTGALIRSAEAARTSMTRDRSLRKITQIAIDRQEYLLAVNAASAIYSADLQEEALTFVSRCTFEVGFHTIALDAAGKMRRSADQARMKNEILSAIKVAESERTRRVAVSSYPKCH